VGNITGISVFTQCNSEFIVFPIPAKDVLKVSLNFETTGISLYDLYGKLVKSYNILKSSIDLIELSVVDIPSGVYLLKIDSSENPRTKKILITK